MSFLLLFFTLTWVGCSFKNGVPQWKGSGFLRKEFLEYEKITIFPFKNDDSGETAGAFARSFRERFPQIWIATRKEIRGELNRGSLDWEKLNDTEMARISKSLGAQAFIMGEISYPSITRWILQVRIVDGETGRMMGRSMVEINYMGTEGAGKGAQLAVEKLALW